MTNYVQKVERIGKTARRVFAIWKDKKIPFVFNTINGKPVRQDKRKKNKPNVPSAEWGQIFNQVFAILVNENIITSNKVINKIDEYIKTRSKEKNNRQVNIVFKNFIEYRWLDILKKSGIFILADGFLRIFRWKNKKRIPQIIDGINSAIRMQDHISKKEKLKNNPSEIKKLESIDEILDFIKSRLTNWKEVGSKEKERIKKDINLAASRLEKCRNTYKKSAKTQMEKSSSLKDSFNRFNPAAIAARNASAIFLIIKRMQQIDIIEAVIAFRKEILIMEKRRQLKQIDKAKAILNGLFRNKIFSLGEIKDYEKKPTCKKIYQTINNLNTIWSFPYSWQAKKATKYLMEASRNVDAKNVELVYIALRNAMTVLLTNLENYG